MAKAKPTSPRKQDRRAKPGPRERTPAHTPAVDDVSDGTVEGEMEFDTDRYELPLSRT
jgi:hypothetical protein